MALKNRFYLLGDNELDDPLALIAHHQKKEAIQPAAFTGVEMPSRPLPPAQAARDARIGDSGSDLGESKDRRGFGNNRNDASDTVFQRLSGVEEDEDLDYLFPNRLRYKRVSRKSLRGNNRKRARRGVCFNRHGRRGGCFNRRCRRGGRSGDKNSGCLRKLKHDHFGCRNWRSLIDECTGYDEEPETGDDVEATNEEMISDGTEEEISVNEEMTLDEYEMVLNDWNEDGWTLGFKSPSGNREDIPDLVASSVL